MAINLKENGKLIKEMELGRNYGKMEIFILANMSLEALKVMDSTIGRMAPTIEVSFYQE